MVTAVQTQRVPDSLAEPLQRLMRAMHQARSHMLGRSQHDLDWPAYALAAILVKNGPMRLMNLAGYAQFDPSTVSRQVAVLVRDGLVQRQADPLDGRASILAPTAKAKQVCAEHRMLLDAHLQEVISDWQSEDRDRFVALLAKFSADFDAYRLAMGDAGWASPAANPIPRNGAHG